MEDSVIKGCKISYIELARDTRHVSFSKAYVSLSKYSKTLRKKYSGGFIYDGSDKEKNLGKGLVSDSTYYYGTVTGKEKTSGEITINITGKFKFVMYAKISPIDCFQYAHEEWRISNAGNIFKRTGIRTIKDLLIINKGKLFGDFENKFLTHYTINQQKLGMYLHGLNRCRKPSKKIEMRSQLLGAVFCSIHKIQTANDLVSYCMKEKKRIKSKVGRKSKWENRILHINYSMVQDAA